MLNNLRNGQEEARKHFYALSSSALYSEKEKVENISMIINYKKWPLVQNILQKTTHHKSMLCSYRLDYRTIYNYLATGKSV
jgi:hypothetical protein